MEETYNKLNPEKSAFQRLIEGFLLIVCICVLVLRAAYTESPHTSTFNFNQSLSNSGLSLIISTVLILSVIAWLIVSVLQKKTLYRFTSIEAGLFIFLVGCIISFTAAADKRAAITDTVTLLAPMLAAILLVQILDSPSKIRLLLIVAVTLGVLSTYQCFEQAKTSNADMIENYENDPTAQLSALGIEENTLEHFLFKHRLYSKVIRGFLTTSNSTGSFLILSGFAGLGLFIEKLRNRRNESSSAAALLCGLVTVVIFAGLLLTRSKGAISAGAAAGLMLVCYLAFGKQLYRSRKVILVLVVLAVIAAAAGVIRYGLAHERLPGGNSMLVRWQYWHSAAKMYADKALTGVGAGNFASYYTHYKADAALETVQDPHNFILSLLVQYGPVGLIGFLAGILIPLYRKIFSGTPAAQPEYQAGKKMFTPLLGAAIVFILVTLLLFRPMFMADELGDDPAVKYSVILILYILPACVFVLGFAFLWSSQKDALKEALPFGTAVPACIFCGIVGVLIANIIDFAIFEPAVLTLLWMMIACLIAIDRQSIAAKTITFTPSPFMRLVVSAVCIVIVCVYINFALTGPLKAGAKTQQAVNNLNSAHRLLALAAEYDPLDPAPMHKNGNTFLQHYNGTGRSQPQLLQEAAGCFSDAIVRDRADYKNYAKLSSVYQLLAENAPRSERTEWLQKALETAQAAVERYPGSGKLHLELAKIAEELGNTELALCEYCRSVEIENSYQKQFETMYPEWDMVSRIGWEKLQFAKERIEFLSK